MAKSIRAYRFHDSVAFSHEDMDETIYISSDLALKFIGAMTEILVDINDYKFPDSEVGTIDILLVIV